MSDAPLRIAPGTDENTEVVLKDAGKRERKTRYRDRKDTAATEVPALAVYADATVEHSQEPIEEPRLTWAKYIEWRKGKCPKYDYTEGPKLLQDFTEKLFPTLFDLREDALDEVNHAIHEFVGEVAELGELFLENGAETFVEPARTKLVDECGDILFCACWVMDAYGQNPIDDIDGIELIRFKPGHVLLEMADLLKADMERGSEIHTQAANIFDIEESARRAMLEAQIYAGLLCNSYKKLRYQRRAQDVSTQISRVVGVLFIVNQFLVLASSTVLDALLVNTAKLDARFPNGHTTGGGNRTGKGA